MARDSLRRELEASRKRVEALQQLFDAAIQDRAEMERLYRELERNFDSLTQSCRELLEMGCVLQQERDAARRVARDALVVAGFSQTLSDIERLPTWGVD